MFFFKARTTFDKVFEVGILLKAADGLIETAGGLILLTLNPDSVNKLAKLLTENELNANPHNLIANHIIHWAGQLTKKTIIFGAIYLLAHGISKIILVYEILRNELWAYIGLIILTALFIIYQVYEVIFSHSIGLSLLTIFDVAIVYLTVKEYKKQRKMQAKAVTKE